MVKNAVKALAIITLIWLPTGPSDFIITPAIINVVGLKIYIIISIILVYMLYKDIEGKTLGDKLRSVHKGIKQVVSH